MSTSNDFTETGLRVDGPYENDRNSKCAECFKAVIREVFGVTDVIIAHHLVYVVSEKHSDDFVYQVVEEIPAADTLIFDHEIAKKLWGRVYKTILVDLVLEPVETRDELFCKLYYGRASHDQATVSVGDGSPRA